MSAAARVLARRYVDSVVLMRLARRLGDFPGVTDAAAVMATDANKLLLAEGDFATDRILAATPDDLVVAVHARDVAVAQDVLGRVDELLAEATAPPTAMPIVTTIEAAVAVQPGSNLAVISVPGEHAAGQARRALELGLHAFVFSSNVALEDEIALKQLAARRGLLCMGPDCGTALISGRGVGFANAVARGPVGIVAAAGTGIQAIASYLDRWGVGVSHAIGAGSRDGTDEVGGSTMHAALRALDADPGTEAIVLLAKPPGAETATRLRAAAAAAGTPVVVCFLGDAGANEPTTLDDAARCAARLVGVAPAAAVGDHAEGTAGPPRNGFVRGLYSGGTLAYEAQLVLAAAGLTVRSNIPLPGAPPLDDPTRSEGHAVIDLGTEQFTRGRPHPMIDARTRRARIRAEAADPRVAVILLDIVLGYGAAPDPAGDLADVVLDAITAAEAQSRPIRFVASVCGTDRDPQVRSAQEATLRAAGVAVAETNAAAARLAATIAVGGSS